jgi:hypothetical protein
MNSLEKYRLFYLPLFHLIRIMSKPSIPILFASSSIHFAPSPTAPAPRSGHTAVAHRGGMFVFGGQCVHALSEEEQTGEFFADVWRFDLGVC